MVSCERRACHAPAYNQLRAKVSEPEAGLQQVLELLHAAAPGAMIGTSNFFELAVAVAISLYGLNSGAVLATVVGVLVAEYGCIADLWAILRLRCGQRRRPMRHFSELVFASAVQGSSGGQRKVPR